jgi:lysozyme family protein
MAAPSFTPELQASYQRLFDTCVIAPDKYPFVTAAVEKMLASRSRYEAVEQKTSVPWYFIAIVHYMEGGGKFTTHLHNGDPLKARTVNVPKGRPKTGTPPFTWEFSAEDALAYTGVNKWTDWSLPGLLYKLEGYNGFGYRRASININSPYLWSFSNHYKSGKYVADGKYSPAAVSKQCGAAVILRRMAEMQIITFGQTDRMWMIMELGKQVSYAPSKYVAKAEELQKLLNLNGAHIRADGKAGKITSGAYFEVTGEYLKGDPRRA